MEGHIDLLRITKREHLKDSTLKRTTRLRLHSACCVRAPQTVLLSSPSLSQCTPSVHSREQRHSSRDYTRHKERPRQPPDECAQILVSPSMEGRLERDNRERAYVHRRDDKLTIEQEHLDRLRRDPQLHCRPRSPKVGLTIENDPRKKKVVNSEAWPIVGVSKRIPLKLEAWSREMDLAVVRRDDFDVVLGMDFLLEHKVISMPLSKCLVITDHNPKVVLPTSTKQPKHQNLKMISVI